MIEKIPEEKPTNQTIIYSPVIKAQKKSGGFVDIFTLAITIVIFVAMIASYFVTVKPSAEINIQEITVEVVWLAAGTFSIGALIKRYCIGKGRKTEDYKSAQESANKGIETLCNSEFFPRVTEYCENYTAEAIKNYRKHQLLLVGLTLDEYEKKYQGKSFFGLLAYVKRGEITFAQAQAARRCNRLKIKEYDPNFITSYNADLSSNKSPSEMYNAERANKKNTVQSLILTTLSSLFIGRLFTDVFLNTSKEAIFLAIIKIITILINVAFKATFGWNIAQMETQRNKLRTSEAAACITWCKNNPAQVKEQAREEVKAENEPQEPTKTAETAPVCVVSEKTDKEPTNLICAPTSLF